MKFDEVKWFEFEISRLCNARCPLCTRTEILDNPRIENFPQDFISLEQIKKVFDPYDLTGKSFRFNGAVGDPMTNPDIFPIVKYLFDKSEKNTVIDIHTNGGLRNTKFWEEFGQLSKEQRNKERCTLRITFAIDGFEDTNHIYRVGVNYNEVIDNLKTYIATGGQATWAFIVFDHNAHQLEEAREKARALGCKNFIPVKAFRNINNKIGIKQSDNYTYDKVVFEDYKKLMSNKNIVQMAVQPQSFDKMTDFTDNVHCFYVHDKTVYIMGGLTVWPCCMIYDNTLRKNKDTLRTLEGYEEHFNDLNYKTLDEVLASEFLNTLPQRWNTENSRFTKTCIKSCSNKGKFHHENRGWENL